MPKLIDNEPSKFTQIGRDGLMRFADEMNANRARAGIRRRYKPTVGGDGKMTLEFWDLPFDVSPHDRGPIYSGPRLVHG